MGKLKRYSPQVPDGWRMASLGEVADVSFSSVDKKIVDGEVPVELCNYTDVFYNRRIRAGMKLMTATATPAERDTWSLKKGDVLFTKDSETSDEIGVPAYVSDDMPNVLCGYHLGLARPSSDLACGAFLARALASHASAQEFSRIANGVTRFGLTLGATRSLPILLPSPSEQQTIVAVLDSIDDAIERTEAVIAAMERLRDALLHELLTHGVPGWHTEWKEEPGIGTIPASWDVVRLGEVCEVKGGKRLPKGSSFADRDTGMPYIRVVDFADRTVDASDIQYLDLDIQQKINRYTIGSSDVYISIAGTIGLVGIVPSCLDGANLTENAAKIVILDLKKISAHFLMSFLDSYAGQSQISLRVTVLGQPKLALERIRTIALPMPSSVEQRTVAKALSSVDHALKRAREERNGLQSVKVSVSDALLTGRMRVGRGNA